MGRPKGQTASPAATVQAKRNRAKAELRKADVEIVTVVGDDPEVDRRMADMGLPAPSTWQEARIREQTRAEIYRTIAASVELQRTRGLLVPRDQVTESADRMRDTLQSHVERIPRHTIDALDLPPAIKAQVHTACEASVRLAFAEAIAEARKK